MPRFAPYRRSFAWLGGIFSDAGRLSARTEKGMLLNRWRDCAIQPDLITSHSSPVRPLAARNKRGREEWPAMNEGSVSVNDFS